MRIKSWVLSSSSLYCSEGQDGNKGWEGRGLSMIGQAEERIRACVYECLLFWFGLDGRGRRAPCNIQTAGRERERKRVQVKKKTKQMIGRPRV